MAVVVSFVGKWDGKDVARAQKEIAKFSDESSSKFGGFAKKAGVAVAAVGAAAVGVGAIFAKQAISAAEDAATAQARLEQVAQSMGFVGGEYAGATQRLQEYASELSKQIAVEDESILAVQAKLATFREVGATMDEAGGAMDRATQAAFNLAAAGFGDAESNAVQLGKALQDPIKGITALSRAGVTFTEQEKEKIKAMVESGDVASAQNMILSALEEQVGGVAEATANASDKMAVGFGELQESVGMALLPAFNELVDTLLPVFEELQGPLSEIAATVGGALSEALKAISPLIGPLAEAFAQVAGTVANVLVKAVEALIPAITPILEIVGDLAQRAAPLLEKILGKVAQVLVKVLGALTPLLEPLIELVFGILDAAWPIVETVIDVFLMLVDAVTPLLDAVMMLLTPLGELIEVGLKAIMPVIQPLLPVIEALAAVLADVLTRAIGLIMSGIGGLIVAFSKLAPFIINNVTRPILDNFLKFAENLVGAAESAFGWVPGLGDKLGTAKDAISKFRKDADDALAGAADEIAEEGERIGKGLIDQGVQAMTDPDAIRRTREAGEKAGETLADGMALGIRNGQIPVQAASRGLVTTADGAARRAAESSSPSKLFARLGKDLGAGLVQGIEGSGEDVRKALQTSFNDWFKNSVEKLKQDLRDAKQEFRDFAKDVSSAVMGSLNFGEAQTGAAERVKAIAEAEAAVAEAAAKATSPEATDSDRRALVDAQKDLDFAKWQGETLGTSFLSGLQAQTTRAIEFARKIRQLIDMGLKEPAWQQVLAAGAVTGTAIADELIAGGQTAIDQTNDLVQSAQTAADEIGVFAAGNFRQAGVDTAQKTYEGFKANFGKGGPARKALMGVMDNLAAAAARDVRINVEVTRAVNEVVTRVVQTIDAEPRALGGPVAAGSPYLIGERGPELFIPDVSGYVVSNADLRAGRGSAIGGNVVINVNAGLGTDGAEVGRQVVNALKAYERRNGAVYASA